LLNSGQVDAAHGTITLPLYLGHLSGSGKNVWYILTDVDNPDVAAELGLNFSAKLAFASDSARTGNLDADGNIVFDAGTVNFAPERKIIPPLLVTNFPPRLRHRDPLGTRIMADFTRRAWHAKLKDLGRRNNIPGL
jgi:hypothetical protein